MCFDLNQIDFSYRRKQVIRSLDLHLPPGKFYGILGPNGSGKTTLIDLMVRHLKPDSGLITYYGKDLNAYSRKELATQIALVPQIFQINFPFRVEEIVMMGRYPHIPRFAQPRAEDWEILEQVLTWTDTSRLRRRYVNELSGGERQRVMFARALAQTPRVLLLDEATSNMDVKHSLKMLAIAGRLKREQRITIIAVFQDINLAASHCDELIFLKDGSPAAGGATAEVLTPETLKMVFEIDAKVAYDDYAGARQVVFKGDGVLATVGRKS